VSERKDIFYPSLNLLLAFFLLNVVLQPLTDPDFWWHLRSGVDLIHNGWSPPATDPYSHTLPDWPWVNHSWLLDGIIGMVYTSLGPFGLLGVILLFAGIRAAAFILSADLSRVGWPYRLLAVAGALWVARPFLGATHMTTLLGLAVVLWLSDRYLTGHEAPLWVIPPVFLLWANLHAGFPAGLVVLLVIGCVSAVARLVVTRWPALADRIDEPVMTWVHIRRFTWCTVASGLATFANPYGWRLHEEIYQTLSDPLSMTKVVHWQTTTFTDPTGIRYGVDLAALALAAALFYRRVEPIRLAVLTTCLVTSLLHWYLIPLFLLVSVPLWADLLAACTVRLRAACPTMQTYPKRWLLVMTLIAALTLGALGPGHMQQVARSGLAPEQFFRRTWYPIEAIQWVQANRHLVGARLLNHFDYGGFLLWWLPDVKVFIDGRMPYWNLDDRRIFSDYLALFKNPPALGVLDKYHVDWALMKSGSRLDTTLSGLPDWQVLYRDRKATVYVKRRK